jgi:hypothetical protein
VNDISVQVTEAEVGVDMEDLAFAGQRVGCMCGEHHAAMIRQGSHQRGVPVIEVASTPTGNDNPFSGVGAGVLAW